MNNSIGFFSVLKEMMQGSDLSDGNVHCSVPLNILVPKLSLKFAKELANLHDMYYMPSKIRLKNAYILLGNHKCETCPDFLNLIKQLPMLSINKHSIK